MARNGPFFPDTRPGRKAVVHYPNGRGDPGTIWCETDTSEQMADAFNRAFEKGREFARAELRQALGLPA